MKKSAATLHLREVSRPSVHPMLSPLSALGAGLLVGLAIGGQLAVKKSEAQFFHESAMSNSFPLVDSEQLEEYVTGLERRDIQYRSQLEKLGVNVHRAHKKTP